jgi:choline-glycine betaine transporter
VELEILRHLRRHQIPMLLKALTVVQARELLWVILMQVVAAVLVQQGKMPHLQRLAMVEADLLLQFLELHLLMQVGVVAPLFMEQHCQREMAEVGAAAVEAELLLERVVREV